MKTIPLRFTTEDAAVANVEWGANCGPGAIAAVCGLTLDELRPFMGDFEKKHYTNPSLMWATLVRLGIEWATVKPIVTWPMYGLARIQWQGPWTAPGVPARVAYRHTHWVGANGSNPMNIGIFDINCMNSGGWVGLKDWATVIVPHILEECEPKADGRWFLTHVIEVAPHSLDGLRDRLKVAA